MHPIARLTDFSVAEAQVARATIDQSDSLIVRADSSKFNHRGPFSVCPLTRVNYLVADDLTEGGPEQRAESVKGEDRGFVTAAGNLDR